MKRSLSAMLVLLFLALPLVCAATQLKVETSTGKVSAVDLEAKTIVVMIGTGAKARVIGAIVTPQTVIKVKGKKAALSDIKVGDKVKIKIERTTDEYAKAIWKK